MAHGDITHTEIPVTDMARAKSFYSDLFGWKIEDYPGYDNYPMWRNPNEVSGGALTPREDGFTQPRVVVEVDSIENSLARAEAAGGKVVLAKTPIDETSWWAIMEDPDGNQLGLFEGQTGGS
ncbi:VOC family protein [Tessaracoccus sp. OS52]|uniref:VOC family protein n=1 Tax=Tessaracoccus sp. OS52 TaxID=2886691 RepID=UPI001D120B34|nr:VOC family protein [Tessaracoccus sp. OS52]MCC2594109.1 VOC family protein [Tessaracoccus sp. OS52]